MNAEAVRASARAALEASGGLPDEAIDLAGMALAFARIALPEADTAPTVAHLAQLAQAGATLSGCTEAEERALALRTLLASGHGYTGDVEHYEDPANANLIRVVERRLGLPVALGVIWLHVARAARFDAWGIDFPGHFLLGLGGEGGSVTVDVFDSGSIREEDELAALLTRVAGAGARLEAGHGRPMTRRGVLLRLQNNIRLRHLRAGALDAALSISEDMLRLAPELAPLWREAGELAERLGRRRAAIAAWERVAALEGGAAASAALDRLTRRLN